MWRLGGLERDVVIYSQPKVHIRDFKSISTLDYSYENGLFRLTVNLVNHYEIQDFDIEVGFQILDPKNENEIVLKGEKELTIKAGIEKDL